ncbi:hypothetical protein [[Mycobacterium] crassicus]|uniref:PE family protein n=1 Tax=[Mycobacterium] crassicus TaxID=2872309 RepID=A0ABU5XF44_9MYCO|nr:hypothetical protein [Mycolicibacter sp. MYC098]MEB3020918.1 hypothetical protein [Mycolicibacter sp. MYC098]
MSGQVSRFGVGASLVGGTVAVALTLGLGGAHADAADQFAGIATAGSSADSTELLFIASTNFLDAKDIFTGIDTSDLSGELLSAVEGFHRQSSILDRAVEILDGNLVPAESSILANSGSLSDLIDQLFLAPLNQQWANAGESMLTATQAFDTAIADGSLADTLSAQFQILGVDFFQVIPAALASMPVVWIGSIFDDAVNASDLFNFSF